MSDAFQEWVGRQERREDLIAEAPLCGLAALLDHDTPPWDAGVAPPLAHWLYFLPRARQSEIDIDGHPKRGGFLPPIDLPRRMWAGGRVSFYAPLVIGARVERLSTISNIATKSGASGAMVFVTVTHEVSCDAGLILREEQDIVYRGEGGSAPAGTPDGRVSAMTRVVTPDEASLFRYSALTFNAHRIHYDRPYATDVEGYPGLVVQGPFIATLLMDHALRGAQMSRVRGFSFRAQRPLFGGAEARLCTNNAGDFWCKNAAGEVTMSARVDFG